jgi:cell division protein FtsW (lipid II flippase)
MAEEWGLMGGLFVLAMFTLILRWGLKVARERARPLLRLLAAGMTFTIFFYMAINLLMVMGLAPVVGIPLPWMSHGGSAMMTNMICIGTIMAVDRWSRRGGLAEKTGAKKPLPNRQSRRYRGRSRRESGPAATPVWTHSSVGRAADS